MHCYVVCEMGKQSSNLKNTTTVDCEFICSPKKLNLSVSFIILLLILKFNLLIELKIIAITYFLATLAKLNTKVVIKRYLIIVFTLKFCVF